MRRSPLNTNQTQNLRYILERARHAGLSADDAYVAAWFAFAESSLGENLKGKGTISGMYHYTDGTWEDRKKIYQYDEETRNYSQFKDFAWKINKDQTSAQVTVLLADLNRYREEFERLSRGANPKDEFEGNPQGLKAWERFVNPANDVPFTFEDYAYLRHNTTANETKKVNGLRTADRDGVYRTIRDETDILYNPGYVPGPGPTGSKGFPDDSSDLPGNGEPLTESCEADDDQDQFYSPSPGM